MPSTNNRHVEASPNQNPLSASANIPHILKGDCPTTALTHSQTVQSDTNSSTEADEVPLAEFTLFPKLPSQIRIPLLPTNWFPSTDQCRIPSLQAQGKKD